MLETWGVKKKLHKPLEIIFWTRGQFLKKWTTLHFNAFKIIYTSSCFSLCKLE